MKRGAGASVFGYFWGNAKSDWPRAAMEREGGKDYSSFVRPFAALRANGRVQSSLLNEPPSPPAFAGAGSNPLPRGERRQGRAPDETKARRAWDVGVSFLS